MESVLTPLAKSALVPLGLRAVASSATYIRIQKKRFGECRTIQLIPNKEQDDLMEIIKSLEESGLLTKRVSTTIKNKEN